MTDTPDQWRRVKDHGQPPENAMIVLRARGSGNFYGPYLAQDGLKDDDLWWVPTSLPIVAPPLDAIAPPPEPERPAPLYEVGAKVVCECSDNPHCGVVDTIVDRRYVDHEWRYNGESEVHYHERHLRRATPAELYPVGSPDRIDEFNHGWRITGHREGDYALEVESLTAHPAIRPVHETRSVAEWEAMELAPEPPPEPTIEERFPVGSWVLVDSGANHGDLLYRFDDDPYEVIVHDDTDCAGRPIGIRPRVNDRTGRYQCALWPWPNDLTPCDPPEPPAPAGPWRPTSETPEVGQRTLILADVGRVERWSANFLPPWWATARGWLYMDDALALIDAVPYDVQPIETLEDDHDERVLVWEYGKWVSMCGTRRENDARHQRTHWCPLPPVPPIPEGE